MAPGIWTRASSPRPHAACQGVLLARMRYPLTKLLPIQTFPAAGLPMLSNKVALDSYPLANPLNNSVTVTQSNGGVALDPHDSRLTQVSYMDGMLWTGMLLSAVSRRGLKPVHQIEKINPLGEVAALHWTCMSADHGDPYTGGI